MDANVTSELRDFDSAICSLLFPSLPDPHCAVVALCRLHEKVGVWNADGRRRAGERRVEAGLEVLLELGDDVFDVEILHLARLAVVHRNGDVSDRCGCA